MHCPLLGVAYYTVLGRHDHSNFDRDDLFVWAEVPHPSHNRMRVLPGDNDFLLLFLVSNSTTEYVTMVKLNAYASIPSVGQEVTVVGWGILNIADDFDKLVTNDDMGTSYVSMNLQPWYDTQQRMQCQRGLFY